MENVSLKLNYFKKQMKLTNEKVAQLAGLPVATVERISSGRTKNPNLKTLKALSKVFDCSLDELINLKDTTQPYYLDAQTAEMAQELHDNPEMRILFDASKKLTPEEMQIVINVANGLKKNHQ